MGTVTLCRLAAGDTSRNRARSSGVGVGLSRRRPSYGGMGFRVRVLSVNVEGYRAAGKNEGSTELPSRKDLHPGRESSGICPAALTWDVF